MDPDTRAARGAETLIEILDDAATRGYGTQQIARSGGRVECNGCDRTSAAGDLDVDHVRRLEGASDAADEMIVVWARCPACDRRGVLTLAYGPAASGVDADVIEQLDLSRADPAPPQRP